MTYFINTTSDSPDARNTASGQESKVQSRTEYGSHTSFLSATQHVTLYSSINTYFYSVHNNYAFRFKEEFNTLAYLYTNNS